MSAIPRMAAGINRDELEEAHEWSMQWQQQPNMGVMQSSASAVQPISGPYGHQQIPNQHGQAFYFPDQTQVQQQLQQQHQHHHHYQLHQQLNPHVSFQPPAQFQLSSHLPVNSQIPSNYILSPQHGMVSDPIPTNMPKFFNELSSPNIPMGYVSSIPPTTHDTRLESGPFVPLHHDTSPFPVLPGNSRAASPNSDEMAKWGHRNEDGTWRCSHPGCVSRSTFTRGCDLRKHFKRHTKAFYCRVEGCSQAVEGGFSSKKDRTRHEAKHNPSVICEWDGCDRLFSRVDNMKDHVRRVHKSRAG